MAAAPVAFWVLWGPRGGRGARAVAVADEHRRVEARLGEDVAGHVRDSGLAVAAADRDGLGAFDDLGEGFGACDHTHAHRACRLELGRILDGAAVDEQVLTEHVLRVVTDVDRDAGVLELGGGCGGLRVAAPDLVPARDVYARQRGNPGAADAHQVNPHRCATSRTTSSTRCAASRRPAADEACAM